MYFNTHTHLNSDELYYDRDYYIQNCLKLDVNAMVVVGYDMKSSKRAVEIASQNEFIYATVGISPNDLEGILEEDLKVIEELASHEKVVAIGEIGLDYYYDEDKELQKAMFLKQIDIAKKVNKPIVIHCRDAYEDTYHIVEKAKIKGIMHCYSGSDQMAMRFIKLGYYISLAGPVTFKNAKMPKLVAQNVPLESLLIETDDPYMAPVPYRGKMNEPANVIYIAKEIAKLKHIKEDEVAIQTYKNALKAFHIED